jgi:hypothetical protein
VLQPGTTKEDLFNAASSTVADLVQLGPEGHAAAKTITDNVGLYARLFPEKKTAKESVQSTTATVFDEKGNPTYVTDKNTGVTFVKKHKVDIKTGEPIKGTEDLVKVDDATAGGNKGRVTEEKPEHYYFNYDQATNEPISVNFETFNAEKDPNKVRNRLENTLETQRLQKARDVTANREALGNMLIQSDPEQKKAAEEMLTKSEQELAHTEKKLKLLRTNKAPAKSAGYAAPAKPEGSKKGKGATSILFSE